MKNGKKAKSLALDLLFMLVGSMVYAVSVNAFTAPNNIAPGGVTGIATMLNYLFATPIGLVVFLINVPIILWAVLEIGYKLVAKTIVAIVLSSVMIDLFSWFIPVYRGDPILVALLAGVCEGVGLSLTFIRGATTGGTDMIARLLGRRMPHLSMGKLMLAIDGLVVLALLYFKESIMPFTPALLFSYPLPLLTLFFTVRMWVPENCFLSCLPRCKKWETVLWMSWTAA